MSSVEPNDSNIIEEVEENEELQDLENDYEETDLTKGDILKHISLILGPLVLVFVLIMSILLYPFYWKVSGEWSSDSEGIKYMNIEKNGNMSLQFPNFSNIEGYTVRLEGKLKKDGMNQYIVSSFDIYATLQLEKVSQEVIEQFDSASDFYDLEKQTEYVSIYKFTNTGKETFLKESESNMILTLENIFPWNETELYINYDSLSDKRILFLQ